MADLTKCKGDNCPLKETCKRYTSEASLYQSWFVEPPIKDGKCTMYWGAEAEGIFNQFNNIVNGAI